MPAAVSAALFKAPARVSSAPGLVRPASVAPLSVPGAPAALAPAAAQDGVPVPAAEAAVPAEAAAPAAAADAAAAPLAVGPDEDDARWNAFFDGAGKTAGPGPLPSGLLHHERTDFDFFSLGFTASNEFDWFRAPMDRRPAEAFIILGNNSGWDAAMRRGAKALFVGDRDPVVIQAHQRLYEPLFKAARSPADFLSMLGGVELAPSMDDAPLDDVFDAIERGRADWESRTRFAAAVERRLAGTPGVSAEQRAFVGRHLSWLARPKERRRYDDPKYAGGFNAGYAYAGKDDPYPYFRDRYRPGPLRKAASDPALVDDPFFSVFSSREAFERIRSLYAGGKVRYFVSDFQDEGSYQAVGAAARELGLRVSGLWLSNIVDVSTMDQERAASLLLRAADAVRSGAKVDETFTVYNVRRTSLPHAFESLPAASDEELLAALKERAYPVAKPSWLSDYSLARDSMLTNVMHVPVAERNRVFAVWGRLEAYLGGLMPDPSSPFKFSWAASARAQSEELLLNRNQRAELDRLARVSLRAIAGMRPELGWLFEPPEKRR